MPRESSARSVASGDLRAAMDRLLITHGAYIPVELLLDLGWLRWSDYEAWRQGELASIERALGVDVRDVSRLLRDAADWASTLGLAPERQAYFGWATHSQRQIAFGETLTTATEALLATHYLPPQAVSEGAQLDIFMHSGKIAALEAMRVALRSQDPAAARQSLHDLAATAPEHRLLPAASQLTAVLAELPGWLPPDAAEHHLAFLEQVVEPAARELLGADARPLLAACWRRLAKGLSGVPFDPERPSLHASYAYLRCHDYRDAMITVLETPAYAAQPAFLARLAEARRRDGDRKGAIETWCVLCWHFPAAAITVLDNPAIPDSRLRGVWLEFRELDLDPPAETVLFPARLLLAEPGLARALPHELGSGDSVGEQAFCKVRSLLREDGIEARKSVRAVAPWLLECYLGSHV